MTAIDLSNTLEWNTVAKVALGDGVNSVPDYYFETAHHELVLGIKVGGQPNWHWGGYLIQFLEVLPTTTAVLFPRRCQVGKWRLTCDNYQAIRLDNSNPLPYTCKVSFPSYFKTCQLEVYVRNDA
jgi:hypothetical protein